MKKSINSPPREQKKNPEQRASCRFIAGFSKSASSRERNDRLFRAKTDLLSLASFTWLNGRFPSANLNTKRESALGGVHTGGDTIEGREIGFVCEIPRLGEGHFGMGWFRHLVSDTLGGGMVMESGSIIGSVTKFVGKLGGYSFTTLKN